VEKELEIYLENQARAALPNSSVLPRCAAASQTLLNTEMIEVHSSSEGLNALVPSAIGKTWNQPKLTYYVKYRQKSPAHPY
jgi:hypothetical protein